MTEQQTGAWLTVIGIGDNGLSSLTPEAQSLLWQAETIVLGERLDAVLSGSQLPSLKRVLNWSGGFRDTLEQVLALRGTPVTVLATGDPMHFGIGATLRRYVPAREMLVLPSPSAFSLAAARLGWPLQTTAQISLHGRPVAHLVRHMLPGARILALTGDRNTAGEVAERLIEAGFGPSVLTVLEHMGGTAERIVRMTADDVAATKPEIDDFYTLGIDVAGDGAVLPPVPGLPDDAFRHDGQLTKREIRAVTLSMLKPQPNALLWDVGAGCGSISVEWLRCGMGTEAIAIEAKAERRAMIAENADRLGVPDLQIVEGLAPAALEGLPAPDRVFIGGGINHEGVFEACFEALKPGGLLVANAVTIEGEGQIAYLRSTYGGDLVRLQVSRSAPVGRYCGWKSLMPVTIWALTKGEEK
ncbi:precorrin-6y C5,15-methyltransferase (decarboxylating) subunit CbiE [Pseudomonas sp. R2.Fl]|nr:precorrin-6y C5,15-methyltransferase (decarboxylating) subunit CbiE [Pseudomonas sp. R2.Fl]